MFVFTPTPIAVPGSDLPIVQLTLFPQSPIINLNFYESYDLDASEIFSDPTVASIVLCDDSGIVPTPTPNPTVVPEPGSGILLLIGLIGVLVSWRLKRIAGPGNASISAGKRPGRWWLLLLVLSVLCGMLGLPDGTVIAQYRQCLLTVERSGSGSGRVTGGSIDCGETCTLSSSSGEVLHLKALPGENSRFVEWQVNGEPSPGLFRMSSDTILTAVFEEKHPPIAVNDSYSTDEDVDLLIPAPGILDNDSDPDGDTLTAELAQAPLRGVLTLNPDGSFRYTPDSDFYGIDQFLYRVSDGELESAIAAVTIDVLPQSDAPIADDLSVETVMNASVEMTLQGHDPDGDSLLYRFADLPANGSLSASDNQVEYTPNADFTGQDSFTYLVNDGSSDSNLATVTITVKDIDLAIGDIDLSQTTFDPQTMTLSGSASVIIENSGAEPIDGGYALQLFVKDLQQDSTVELGTVTISGTLAPGDTFTIDVPINGVMPFKDAPVSAFVDSANAIAESNEENNIAHNLIDCQMEPAEPGSFDPVLEWEKIAFTSRPESNNVMMTPVVGDLNGDQIPESIFSTFVDGVYVSNGVLRAIDGKSGEELWSITDEALEVMPCSGIAIGDLDHDGTVEIVAVHETGHLMIFAHDGTFIRNLEGGKYIGWGGPVLADLDHDGQSEIIAGATVFHHDGTLKWKGTDAGGTGEGRNHYGALPLVVDLDLDGMPEVVAGNSAYHHDGTLYWNASMTDGYTAVANFDDDPFPEIVMVSQGGVYLVEHTGVICWGPVDIPHGGYGGPPTIADLDRDGAPEIGVAGRYRYLVLETNGTIKWQQPIYDGSSETGSSAFDFDGDGQMEIVYGDEEAVRVYRGTDGQVLYTFPRGNGTTSDLPLIVDVDRDNNAEIVVVANDYYTGNEHGIYVIGDANDSWVNTRKIWNQHSYHITNVNDDGTIPQVEANSWEEHNTYRCNLIENALACEDYSASYVRVDASNFPDSATILARIGNSGIVDSAFPLNVAFYHGDPQHGGTLLDTTTTQGALVSGDYEDVSLTWNAPAYGLHEIYVVVDDDGTGKGSIRESDESNNAAFTVFDKPNYDLAALQVDPADSVFDPQTMGISGSVAVTFENLGSSIIESDYTVQVYIEDAADGTQQTLGSLPVSDSLSAGDSLTLDIPIDGTLLFKDQPLYALVDSKDVIDETDETNNLSHTLVECLAAKVGYWTFDATEQSTAFDSFDDNDGQIHGAQEVAGQVQNALYFDGDDFISIPDNAKLRAPSDAVTIEAWIKPANHYFGHILAKQYDGVGLPYQYLYDSYILWIANSQIFFSVYDGSAWQSRISHPIEFDVWQHVVGTWDLASSTMTLYINGQLRARGVFRGLKHIVYDESPLFIGADSNNAEDQAENFWHGALDEVALYDRALTEEEVRQHYEDGLQGIGYPTNHVTAVKITALPTCV